MKDSLTAYRQLLKDSVQPLQYEELRERERTLLGFPFEQPTETKGVFSSTVNGTSDFPYYDRLIRGREQYMRPNPMLNNLRILVAQTRAVEITPDWQGTETDLQSEIRKAWWRQRAQGIDGYGGWKDDLDRAFMDFVSLGLGYLRIGVLEFEDGARVSAKYLRPYDVVLDPYAESYEEARYVAFASIVSLEYAKERYPNIKDIETYAESYASVWGTPTKGVRIIECYTVGWEDLGGPSYVTFIRDFDGPIAEEGDNPFGFLPIATFAGLRPCSLALPMGLVELQAHDAQRIIEEEERIAEIADREQQLIVFASMLDPDVWQRLKNGENPRYIAANEEKLMSLLQQMAAAGLKSPVFPLERVPVSQDHYAQLSYYNQQIDEKSGVGANASGQAIQGSATATEVQSINARLGAQTQFLSREFARAYSAFACKVGKAAKLFDTAPFTAVVEGIPVSFNDGDPMRSAEVVWDGPLIATIGEEELIRTDINARQERELQKALTWFQLTQNPKSLERIAIAMGFKNFEEELPGQDPLAQQMAGQQGLPGTPPVPSSVPTG